ncbi:MAG: glycolate oxidase subunit GlcE, partial [Kordiimonadaceae bacterium]|nr:glycolate oxidase subunit GlcE [Kordiimonadaceae bacterium]
MSDISSQLVEQVKEANLAKTPLMIVGGGTKQNHIGRAIEASTGGNTLRMSGHSGIVSYDPKELVLTARAGTPLREIDAVLTENGQALSFDPPRYKGSATLGGTLACNPSGPARPWAGSVRDMILGVRLINGSGEHMRFGGQVMKNVAGYDVARLQAGALGSLGVLTEISLKVLPQADISMTLVLEMNEANAITRMNEVAGTPAPLNGAVWQEDALYLRFTGAASAVADCKKAFGGKALDKAEQFWADVRDQQLEFFSGDLPLWRFSVHPNAKPLFEGKATYIDWAGAQRW